MNCELWQKTGGENNTQIDCVLWTDHDVTIMTSSSKKNFVCSKLNSLQNVYFGFFLFEELMEWRRFVTYLWNDPRRSSKGTVLEMISHKLCSKASSCWTSSSLPPAMMDVSHFWNCLTGWSTQSMCVPHCMHQMVLIIPQVCTKMQYDMYLR